MLFEVELGLKKKTYNNMRKRIAVRAIIMKSNNILMVKNNKGDYKFPGGGAKPNFSPVWINLDNVIELNEEALISRNESKNPLVYRETTALKEIRKNLNNIT